MVGLKDGGGNKPSKKTSGRTALAKHTDSAHPLCPTCLQECDEGEKTCRRCRTDPWPNDTLVRSVGFRVQHREPGKQSMWSRRAQDKPVTLRQAMKVARKERNLDGGTKREDEKPKEEGAI